MKVAYCNDLHLEFGALEISNTENASVLILAGDITAYPFLKHKSYGIVARNTDNFFTNVCTEFNDVIYIIGNHEPYHGNLDEAIPFLKERYAKHSNLHILNNEAIVLGDTTFLCGTMWTDCNKSDPLSMVRVLVMNDYHIINGGLLEPKHTVEEFYKFMDFLCHETLNSGKYVVVTHHAPSYQSIGQQYKGDPINPGYASTLDNFILDTPCITHWIHGHCHNPSDYMIGNTRVLCNPRGYARYEECAKTFQLKYFDV